MNLELNEQRKKKSFKRFLNSFKHSFAGLEHTIKNEQSILIMTIVGVITIILSILLKIELLEWVFIALVIGIVLSFELINTAIEAVVDLVSPEIHPLAKVAKDTASAAVFVSSALAFIIGAFIFIPKIISLVEMGW